MDELKRKVLSGELSRKSLLKLWLDESGIIDELCLRIPNDISKEQIKFSVEYIPRKPQEFWDEDKKLGVSKQVIERGQEKTKHIPSYTREIADKPQSNYRKKVDARVKKLVKDNIGITEDE